MNCNTPIIIVTAAVNKSERSDERERKIADKSVSNAEKSSSLPYDSSRDLNKAALMSSSASAMCSPVARQTSKSSSAVDVELDSSLNSSAAASYFVEENSAATLMLSLGNICVAFCTTLCSIKFTCISAYHYWLDMRC